MSIAITIDYGTRGLNFSVKKDGSTGWCNMSVRVVSEVDGNQSGDNLSLRLPLIGLWVNPFNNIAIKAHMVIDPNDLHQRSFAGKLWIAGSATSGEYIVTVNPQRKIMRYGWNIERSMPQYYDNRETKFHTIYDSKADAIRDILRTLEGTVSIGGVEQTSFSHIGDEVLEGIGFVKIEDKLGLGVPMWIGCPQSILAAGTQSSYGYSDIREQNARNLFKLFSDELATA